MNRFGFLLLIFALAFIAESGGQRQVCGNAGEDYWDLRNIFLLYSTSYGLYPPSWIFSQNYFSAATNTCTPIPTFSCPNTSCDPKFVNGEVATYDYSCSIKNLTLVNSIIANLTGFVVGWNSNCTCALPPTPKGKYLNGYTLNVTGVFQGLIDGTVAYYGCEVTPSYQDTPLTIGSIFRQIFILNGSAHLTASVLTIICFVLASILLA